MALESRLKSLCQEKELEQARSLAKAVLQNDDIVEATLNGDVVTIETDRFIGTHDITHDDHGNKTVDSSGTYEWKTPDITLTVETNTISDAAREAARGELAEEDSDKGDGAEPRPA